MTPFEHALQLVAGRELDPVLGRLQADFPNPDLQPGSLDKRVILQDRIWISRRLATFPLQAMSPRYRANVIGFLRNQEPSWQLAAIGWVLIETSLGRHEPGTMQTQLDALSLLTPGWTTRTPLVRRLLELNAGSSVL